jgi:hypothetical protein
LDRRRRRIGLVGQRAVQRVDQFQFAKSLQWIAFIILIAMSGR